jgi:hypothetical protein
MRLLHDAAGSRVYSHSYQPVPRIGTLACGVAAAHFWESAWTVSPTAALYHLAESMGHWPLSHPTLYRYSTA